MYTSNLDVKPFVPPGPNDSRSPCPALNALANHGYLPHDGKEISLRQLIRALTEVFNLSTPLALVLAVGGVLLCGSVAKLTLTLHDLALHNRIEHDASLVHDNAHVGDKFAPTPVDPVLVDRLLDEAEAEDELTADFFGKMRARREAEALVKPLNFIHANFARGESALILTTLGHARPGDDITHRVVSVDAVRDFLGKERFPDGWVKSKETIGLFTIAKLSGIIRKAVLANSS
ncbi:Cloroperoxidase [Sistotremastrum niveocremeum HHB9708]|nr:Cloroperoxidase [Sistotremastrum niveocremeum HHB9708]